MSRALPPLFLYALFILAGCRTFTASWAAADARAAADRQMRAEALAKDRIGEVASAVTMGLYKPDPFRHGQHRDHQIRPAADQ